MAVLNACKHKQNHYDALQRRGPSVQGHRSKRIETRMEASYSRSTRRATAQSSPCHPIYTFRVLSDHLPSGIYLSERRVNSWCHTWQFHILHDQVPQVLPVPLQVHKSTMQVYGA